MSTEVESLLATYREKFEAVRKDAEFYGQMIAEIEAAMPAKTRRKANTGGATTTRTTKAKSGRKKPVKAEVPAAEAVTRLLAGCRMGLPAGEIIQSVSIAYGHKPNSLRTTLYNLKKSGAIVQSEDGLYNHPENVG
jgi:hypothetical protein